MTGARDMREISAVTAAAFAAAEARMGALRAEEARLMAHLADLDLARRTRAHSVTALDAALRAGADLRWEQWVETRRRSLLAELARLRARIENERLALARDFGRKTVAEELLQAVEAAARERLRNRTERGW